MKSQHRNLCVHGQCWDFIPAYKPLSPEGEGLEQHQNVYRTVNIADQRDTTRLGS
jgi:hypothetical protein